MIKSKPDYKLKAKAIESGFCILERKLSLANWKLLQNCKALYDTGEVEAYIKQEEYDNIKSSCDDLLKDTVNKVLFEEAHKINRASYVRRNRLATRINSMLNTGACIFLTLTFTDTVLKATNEETRRKYVTRFLKVSSDMYVANIDYGRKNEREHYHAIVLANNVNHKLWSYGSINFERIRVGSSDKILAKYVCKLVNHAIKETTKRNHTIYSKQL